MDREEINACYLGVYKFSRIDDHLPLMSENCCVFVEMLSGRASSYLKALAIEDKPCKQS